MIALIRKNLRLWGYGKSLALFAGCILFSISGRLNGGIAYERHILSAVSDHYYLTYFVLPIVLLSCFSFIDDDGEPVILRFQSYHSYFLKKMDWGRFDCSHSDGCSNWGNSSVWYRITFRQRMEPCCGCNGSRVIFHSGTAFCQSLAGVCLFYPLSAYWKLADIWNLYVDWTFRWEKVDDPNCNRSLCPLGCVDQASGNSKYSADEF